MAQGHFIITDISGYTEFLNNAELEHAHDILQTLFQAQLSEIKPPFVVSSFRGDAIVMYIPETSYVQPQSVLEALEKLYCSFVSTLEQMQFHTTCPCRACKNMSVLDLKMVAHYGTYVIQKMGDREELLGADVIVPHRMLKNHVIEQTDIKSYALFSDAAKEALQLTEYCDTLHDHAESYEHYGEVKMVVYDLKTAWEREKAKRRMKIPPEEAWVSFEVHIDAPPSLVWDYLTLPELKAKLMGLDFAERTDELGGRIREESEFHCGHSVLDYNYKIVDWEPFNYYTMYANDSITGLHYYETCHFLPEKNGTHFVSSVRKPEGEVPADAQGIIQGIWNQAYGGLKAYVEQDIASGKVTVTRGSTPDMVQ